MKPFLPLKKMLLLVAMLLVNMPVFALATVPFSVSGLQSGDQSVVSFGSDSYLETQTISSDGSYSFSNVPAGSYFIKIEANGYNLPAAQAVIVKENGTVEPQVGIKIAITKMEEDPNTWTHSWSEDVSNSGYTTTAYINTPPTIEFLGVHIVPSDVAFTGELLNKYNIILSDEGEAWTQEYAYRLVETLKTIPYYTYRHELETAKFILTNDALFEDIVVTVHNSETKTVRISKECFTYANPFLVNLDGVRGRFFSKRLHHALVNFATDFGSNRGRVNHILSNRFGCTTEVHNYLGLTAGTTNEDAGRFQQFNADELVSIINMFEELPEGFHKTPNLNYLIRRLNGTKHPLYLHAAAVSWPKENGYIEFMETAFDGDANGFETLRLILHEKTHFLWEYSFSEEIKNDWITLGGWYPDPNSPTEWSTTKNTEFVSAYAHAKNPNEDMAESVAHYLKNPELLQSRSLPKYEFIRDRIMHGTRYISKIPDHLTFEVLNLYPDYDYPGKIKRLEIKVDGAPDEDKRLTIEIELNHMEGFEDGASHAFTRIHSPLFVDVDGGMRSQHIDVHLNLVDGNPYLLRGGAKISKYSKNGYWSPGDIIVSDIHGNSRFEGRNDFVWNMYVNNPLEDLEAPKYVPGSLNYELTDIVVDERKAQNLRITYGITDNVGIRSVYSAINRDGAAHSNEAYGEYDAINQTSMINMFISEFQPSGYYWVVSAICSDYAGNAKYTYFSDSPHDQPIQKIYIESPNPDTQAPEVDLNRMTVYAEPTNPDNPDGETLVTINFYARDDKSGLGGVSYILRDPQGNGHHNYHYHRNSSTRYFEGDPTVWEKYTITCVLPKGSAPGIWGLELLTVLDKVNNGRGYNFVETLIFEPDNSTTDYVLFSELQDDDILLLGVSSEMETNYGFTYRIISEASGKEISGTVTNDQQSSLLKTATVENTKMIPIDISSLPAGMLIVIVEINDESGQVVAVRTETIHSKQVQSITFNPIEAVFYGDQPVVLLDKTDKGLPVNYHSNNAEVATVEGNKLIIHNAGSAIILAVSDGDDNYRSAIPVEQILTVNKAPLTLKAENKTRQVGETNPEFTLLIEGFKKSDSIDDLDELPTISCHANMESPAGFYDIVLSGGLDNNYSYKLHNGQLEVKAKPEKKTQTVTFDPLPNDIEYGDSRFDNFSFQLKANSDAKLPVVFNSSNEEVATINGNMITFHNAGAAIITANAEENDEYLASDPIQQVIMVFKSPLIISAENKTRQVGEANPEFTLHFDGFKKSDSIADLDKLPIISCDAEPDSPAGFYDIILFGGSDNNYSYTLYNGTLEVISSSSIADTQLSALSVYPNPVKDYVNIQGASGKEIVIYNSLGNCLVNKRLQHDLESISVSSWNTGVYFVIISDGGKVIKTMRLIKQ